MNIFSKTNKSVAEAASKVMASTPPVKKEEPKVEQVSQSYADVIASSGARPRFDIAKRMMKEESGKDKRTLHNATSDDSQSNEAKEVQKAKLPRNPVWPKSHSPIDGINKTTGQFHVDEGIDAGLINNYALKLPAPVGVKELAKAGIKKNSKKER
jgi:hypothetical protein